MSQASLVDTLRQALIARPDGSLRVAFSGGPDSTALLHALTNLPEARARGLCALHVDHGLHPDSRRWADRCREFCARLDVPLDIRQVEVDNRSGMGLEAAARDARLAVFARLLQPGEYLLTAHHRDDQAETVLLKLLRGAGPEGLGGMRERRPLAAGWLWRPLLNTPREALTSYLRSHALDSIDDPSNESSALARSFLRQNIMPRLSAHWPRATLAISHSARLNRQTADYLHLCAAEALENLLCATDGSLDAPGWLALHPALQGPVLDQWLHAQGFASPTLAQRDQLQQQIRHASGGRVPLVQWPGTAVHVWRKRLHAHAPLPDAPAAWRSPWHGEELTLPAMSGMLRLLPAAAGNTPTSTPEFDVTLGDIGVRLRPAGDPHTRELRDLFQQAAIPPWRRRRCPLIHDRNGTLLAVADLWQTEAGKNFFDALGRRPQWSPAA
ncbi:MAG TPA: tRNA lysidine(34) synthetase TilS [Rhodanobacteraceae bacterium]|nr:tRNA lysidine(34) synthetase TilS [Rhodanobacteraceae bacterium]